MDVELEKNVFGFRRALRGIDTLLKVLNVCFLGAGILGGLGLLADNPSDIAYAFGIWVMVCIAFGIFHVCRVLAFGTAWTMLSIDQKLGKIERTGNAAQSFDVLTEEEKQRFAREETKRQSKESR